MKIRHFENHGERVEGGYRKVVRLKCCKCGVMDAVTCSNGGSTFPPEVISKKFTSKGWEVGPNDARDICPGCAQRKRSKPIQKIVDYIPRAEPPPEMTREKRRIILMKLEEVYIDEKRGYENGWSDNRVAQDLGVPRAWVTKLRDENFGPSGASEEMTDFLRDADLFLRGASEARDEAKAIRKEIADYVNTLSSRITKVETTYTGLVKSRHWPAKSASSPPFEEQAA